MASAACPTTLTLTIRGDPHLLVDSNNPTAGPRVTTAAVIIANTGTATAYDVYAYLGNGTTPGTFAPGSDGQRLAMLSGASYATRYIGTLAPGESRTVFWMLTYPLTSGQTYQMTAWLSSADGCTAQATHTYTTQSTISAQSDKMLGTVTISPSSGIVHVGNVVTVTLTGFNFGTIGSRGDVWMQPVGNLGFDPACFRLVKTEVYIHSLANRCGYGAMPYYDRLYFPNIRSCYSYNAADYVKYSFLALGSCTTTAMLYQEAAAGNIEAYSADYGKAAASATLTSQTGGIVVEKRVNPTSGGAGTTLTWTISYSNNTNYPAGDPATGNGLTIVDEAIPVNTTYVSGSATCSGSCTIYYSADNGITWTTVEPASQVTNIKWYLNQAVPAGSGGSVGFRSTINPGVPISQEICNSASATIAGVLLDHDTKCINAVGEADLHLTKVVDREQPCEESIVTFTLTIYNAGPANATGVQVTDLLPAGLTYLSSTPSQGSYVSASGVWTVGNVNTGASATLAIRATVDASAGGRTITNSARITGAGQPDPVLENNSANALVSVHVPPMAYASSNSPVCIETAIQLFGGPNGMVSYHWTGPNGFTSTQQNPLIQPLTWEMAGDYTLTVTDANGCTATATTTVQMNTACECPPLQPSNVSPAGELCVQLPALLTCSEFAPDPTDPMGDDFYVASQWQIRDSTGDYATPVYDVVTGPVTSITVPLGVLSPATTYYWHVRHQDNEGAWSVYSEETWFCAESTPAGYYVAYTEGAVTVEFSRVLDGGCTSVATLSSNPAGPLPTGLCPLLPYTEISTTATYSGTITVALGYNDAGLADESLVSMLHWDGAQWVSVPSTVNTSANIVYGEVSSLSPFIPCYPCGYTAGGARGVDVFPSLYIGIAAAFGAGIVAFLLRRRSLARP